MVNWDVYLASLCNEYARWWETYTLTDVEGQQQAEPSQFDLMVQMFQPSQEGRGEAQEKIEHLGVLEGLRKYAPEHVLLIGRPGSGKSTALVRLLLEEAQTVRTLLNMEIPERSPLNSPFLRGEEKSLTPPLTRGGKQSLAPFFGTGEENSALLIARQEQENSAPPLARGAGGVKIPVLVELRYFQTSILERIQAFLLKHDPSLNVDEATLKTWLRQGQLLLLFDGLNELPSEEARHQVTVFRQDYPKTPMVFTTRDLGVGGEFGIAKKLEMQPLSDEQMQEFVRKYLPEQGEQMLQQLGNRLQELGETPLLLLMLCSLFRAKGEIPPNLGLVFREFTQTYENLFRQNVPVKEKDLRPSWSLALERLAFRMFTLGDDKTELRVAISRQDVEGTLREFLRDEWPNQPPALCRSLLEDLLSHHLIQWGAGNKIEFQHQLIQEYYAAEYLLKLLTPPTPLVKGGARESEFSSSLRDAESSYPLAKGGLRGVMGRNGISDDYLKREYLNYLKWTEPLALMLELVEDKVLAERVVELALEVDWKLGARLAGAVKPEFQQQTIALVDAIEIPEPVKIELLSITRSSYAVQALISALKDEDYSVRSRAAYALGEIKSDLAVQALISALKDEDYSVRSRAAYALREIKSDLAVQALISVLKDEDYSVRSRAAYALREIKSDLAVQALISALKDEDYSVRSRAAYAPGQTHLKW